MYEEQKKRLLKAAKDCDLIKIKDALANGANVDAQNRVDNTALIWVSFKGNKECVDFLIECGRSEL